MEEDYIKKIKKEFSYIKLFEEEDDAWSFEGYEFLKKGDFKSAEKRFKKLILSQPEHHDGYEGLAIAYYKQDKLRKLYSLWRKRQKLPADFWKTIALI